jgi:hypothetical protein
MTAIVTLATSLSIQQMRLLGRINSTHIQRYVQKRLRETVLNVSVSYLHNVVLTPQGTYSWELFCRKTQVQNAGLGLATGPASQPTAFAGVDAGQVC